MIGQSFFTGLIVLFWVAEFAFAAIVVYWFVTQGFSEEGRAEGEGPKPLEDWAYTRTSLTMWAAFFGFILLLIVAGA